MLPTKLASAAFFGTGSATAPSEAVVVIKSPGSTGGSECESCRVGVRDGPGAVGGAALRCCAASGITGRLPPGPHRAGTGVQSAYVPTGYVPDGEVMVVTLSSEPRPALRTRPRPGASVGRCAPAAHVAPETRPERMFPGRAQRRPERFLAGGEVRDDQVGEQLALVLTTVRIEHVAAEDRAEGVPVRRPEDAER